LHFTIRIKVISIQATSAGRSGAAAGTESRAADLDGNLIRVFYDFRSVSSP